jgi:hypothetical protein
MRQASCDFSCSLLTHPPKKLERDDVKTTGIPSNTTAVGNLKSSDML